MKVNVRFEDGPISADIVAEGEDEFNDVLNELANFVNDYHKMVNGDLRETRFDWEGNEEQVTLDSIEESEDDEEVNEKSSDEKSEQAMCTESELSASTADAKTEEYRPIVEKTGLSEERLRKIIDCGDAENGPRILASNFLPAESRREETLNGTIVLLTLWKTCHGEFWKGTADIINALEESGMKDERFKRIYNHGEWDTYLQKKGERRGTELGIVPIGEDKGFELIEEMAEGAGI